ncbi:MAG: hypothetical protein HFG10_02275 [Oscillibacter sp.]|jgi:hypothetical protein|nr:hypothetical protein [Oscillibacter sp.]
MKGKTLIIRLAVLAVAAALAAVMMVIGRGHTLYFDNKTIEDYQGQEYKAFERVVVTVKGEEVAKLGKRERGMATWIGQDFKMVLEITEKKGDEPRIEEISIQLPYGVDGVVINLPAYLAGLPEDAWFSEFVPMVEEEPSEEDLPGEGDGFGLEGDMGLEGDLGV